MHQIIVDYLTPMLGEATANNLLRHYCVRMRMSVDDLAPQHLPELADAMRPMLAVWLGSAGATRVAGELVQLGRGTGLIRGAELR
jgi:hypothetical protein